MLGKFETLLMTSSSTRDQYLPTFANMIVCSLERERFQQRCSRVNEAFVEGYSERPCYIILECALRRATVAWRCAHLYQGRITHGSWKVFDCFRFLPRQESGDVESLDLAL